MGAQISVNKIIWNQNESGAESWGGVSSLQWKGYLLITANTPALLWESQKVTKVIKIEEHKQPTSADSLVHHFLGNSFIYFNLLKSPSEDLLCHIGARSHQYALGSMVENPSGKSKKVMMEWHFGGQELFGHCRINHRPSPLFHYPKSISIFKFVLLQPPLILHSDLPPASVPRQLRPSI